MPKYIFYTKFPEVETTILRSGYRGDDYAFLKANTKEEAEQIICDYRNMLLEKNIRTSRMYFRIVDIPEDLN